MMRLLSTNDLTRLSRALRGMKEDRIVIPREAQSGRQRRPCASCVACGHACPAGGVVAGGIRIAVF